MSNTANNATFSTTTVRSGSRSLRLNPSAGQYRQQTTISISSSQIGVARAYIRFATLPAANAWLLGAADAGLYYQSSDGKLYARAGSTNGASGFTPSTNTWYLIDIRINKTGTTWTVDLQVGGAAQGSASEGSHSATDWTFIIGDDTAATGTFDAFYDDLLISVTTGDYPLGAGYVLSYIPNADGTHNVAGANDFELPDGTDITNATTTAFQQIDQRPLPTSEGTYIEGTAPPNPTDYVEWQYEDSVESAAPRAVDAILAVSDAGGAGTCNYTVTLREHAGGTSADIRPAGTQNTGATMLYPRAHFATVPGTSDAWTLTKFNALRSRFLVSDASPDPRVNAAMLEAEYADTGVSTSITGVVAAADAAGLAATVTAVRIAAISGEVASGTSAGLVGSIQIARSVTGELANADAAALDGTITTVRIASIVGEAASATATALDGTITSVRITSIAGELATATADGLAGTIQIAPTISGELATADADALAGAVLISRTISGELATADAAALEGVVTAGSQANATVNAEPATATADGLEGVITAARVISIAGEIAAANAAALDGVVTAVRTVSIVGETASAIAEGLSGAVQIARAVPGEIAQADAAALDGTVTTVRIVTIAAEAATSDAVALEGVISTLPSATIEGQAATASAVALEAVISSVRIVAIAGEPATADSNAESATITATRVVNILGEPSVATADALEGVVTTGAASNATVNGELATATAEAQVAVISALIAVSVSGQPASATSAALLAVITTVRFASISGELALASAAALIGSVDLQEAEEVSAIIEGFVELEDLIDQQIWPNNVDPSGYIDPIEEVIPSGFQKQPDRTELWNL